MHTREARAHGESDERLDQLVVWRSVEVFSAPERAALAWTEVLTTLARQDMNSGLRTELGDHFSEQEIAVLGAEIAMINLWNRIAISNH